MEKKNIGDSLAIYPTVFYRTRIRSVLIPIFEVGRGHNFFLLEICVYLGRKIKV
jgi:hypothetical protein